MTTYLKKGARGDAVRELQDQLNRTGATPPLVVDGDFGAKTETAVRWFQGKYDLVVDGIAGPMTMTALDEALTPILVGRVEPDKSAMEAEVPATVSEDYAGKLPPNASELVLYPTARSNDEIIVHCTATPEGKDFFVSDIRAWHKARGWSDIGYHYVIYRDGSIALGRPVGQVGAHVSGHNTGTIGVSYVGGVASDGKTAKDTRTPEQKASLLWLVRKLADIHRGVKKVTGHSAYANKACPSFDVRKDPLGNIL